MHKRYGGQVATPRTTGRRALTAGLEEQQYGDSGEGASSTEFYQTLREKTEL